MSWPSVELLLRVASFSSCAALLLLRAVSSLRSSFRGSVGHDKEDSTESTLWNVRRLLNMVYADETKIEESLIDDIIEPTENEFAIRAFISTFTSPKASKMSYDEMLETIRDRNESLRVGLVYGREDPWVVPLWGQRLKRVIKNATYYELSPVGHCPNDEAPEAVNLVIESLVRDWFFNDSDDDAVKASSVPLPKSIQGLQ